MAPRGVEEIRNALNEAKKVAAEHEAVANLYSLGSPKYRIEVTAEDYRKAENALDKVVQFATEAWENHDGNISFSRS
jgi:translation initiation factor 2 alpha subunit (eIF-2alpha)